MAVQSKGPQLLGAGCTGQAKGCPWGLSMVPLQSWAGHRPVWTPSPGTVLRPESAKKPETGARTTKAEGDSSTPQLFDLE